MPTWPADADALDREQRRLAALTPSRFALDADGFVAGGTFLAFATGSAGPGRPGDRGWAAATLVAEPRHVWLHDAVVPVEVGASYDPGRLALREGPALTLAVEALPARPAVLLVDATGRDHPRRAGLALHLGAVLDVPTVGVTHRPLRAVGPEPRDEAGAHSPLVLDGETVGAWLRTRRGARPVAVHTAWRTDVETAVDVVLACTARSRTPEPLRLARVAARVARARAEGRFPLTAPAPRPTP